MNLTRKNYKILHIVFNMEVYYTMKEYNEMKNRLTKQLKSANEKIARLEAKCKKLQKDYDVLLESATEPEVAE